MSSIGQFFSELFGPSRHHIWKQVSKRVGAKVYGDSVFSAGKMVLRYKAWDIILDIYKTGSKNQNKYTRLRATYVNRDGFSFKIYREGFFSKLGKYFGMEDFEVGFDRFDKDFIIQGNDYYKLIQFLENEKLRQLIQRQADVRLEVIDNEGIFVHKYPENVDKLEFIASGVIKDVKKLVLLFELFKVALDQLVEIGGAYERETGVNLLR